MRSKALKMKTKRCWLKWRESEKDRERNAMYFANTMYRTVFVGQGERDRERVSEACVRLATVWQISVCINENEIK